MSKQFLRNNKKPWPTKKAMTQVYEKQLWGTNGDPFYSGEGSHLAELVAPYIEKVISFLNSFSTPISVCDLGCGDFNIGRQLAPHTSYYHAIDIVPALIERNKEIYSKVNVSFYCLDIAGDELPKADCVILRQVLQHLSNNEISEILKKVSHYKYLILTEHLPKGNFDPNIDIISGQGIRLKKKSGTVIEKAPFHFEAHESVKILELIPPNGKGIIQTTLYTL